MTGTRAFVAVLMVCAAAFIPSSAKAAPLPGSWCGSDEVGVERPDVVAGHQIHVIYAYPSDGEDRFFDFAPRIARDLAGVDEWWRGQDPTRTPRFDLASFPECDTQFGALDLSSVRLDNDSAFYASDTETMRLGLGTSLARDFQDPLKHYLVYFDGYVNEACGVSRIGPPSRGGVNAVSIVFLQVEAARNCDIDNTGTGNNWPAHVAAHELVHALDDSTATASHPNKCPDNEAHICGSSTDLMAAEASTHLLSQQVLDVGNDDYYGHSAPWWDVQDSPFLVHVDTEEVVGVTTEGLGTVNSEDGGIGCPFECRQPYDRGTTIVLTAVPLPRQRLVGWTGACSGTSTRCDLTVNGPTDVHAEFGPLAVVELSVRGHGAIARVEGTPCDDGCVLSVAPATRLSLVAQPDRGAHFVRWRGACAGTKPKCRLTAKLRASATYATAIFRS